MHKISKKTVSIQELMDKSGVRFGTSGVRGLVTEMSQSLCFAYTLAFLKVIGAKPGTRIAIGMDLRPSSPEIASACATAIEFAGMQADFCGALPTPALAFYAQECAIPGIMVTGSHIPFDRNGIKFYSATGEITKEDEVNISQAVVNLPDNIAASVLPALNQAAAESYVNRYINFFPHNCLNGMRLGFYEHSSVARDLLRTILESLGAEVVSLGRTDVFVPIDTEAVSQVDVEQAKSWAQEFGFDAIISTDGDADRPLLGDENGNWFRGDVVGLLCSQYLGAQAVVTPVSCNTAIELSNSFLKVLRTRIGSPYVIAGMENLLDSGMENVVGFEANGGFLLGSSIHKNGKSLSPLLTRDAVLPILALLALAKEESVTLSQLAANLPSRYTGSDRLQSFAVETSQRILAELATSMTSIKSLLAPIDAKPANINQTDGLRISLNNGEIVHFRPSGNAPELRCYAEADTQERANWLAKECLKLISNYSNQK